MKPKTIYLSCLLFGVFGIIIGSLFKIQHWEGAKALLLSGFTFALIYTIIGIRILYSSNKSVYEKSLWLFGFLFINMITGVAFYFNTVRRTT